VLCNLLIITSSTPSTFVNTSFVPTSHYDKTLITQPSVTLGVVLGLFRVLSAIEFNN